MKDLSTWVTRGGHKIRISEPCPYYSHLWQLVCEDSRGYLVVLQLDRETGVCSSNDSWASPDYDLIPPAEWGYATLFSREDGSRVTKEVRYDINSDDPISTMEYINNDAPAFEGQV